MLHCNIRPNNTRVQTRQVNHSRTQGLQDINKCNQIHDYTLKNANNSHQILLVLLKCNKKLAKKKLF